MFQLQTARLTLRDWVQDDLPLIRALASDPRVTRYQTWLRLPTDDDCQRWLADAIRHNSEDPRFAYNTAIVLRESGAAIGWLGWGEAEDPQKAGVSFGYALLPETWSKGYMSEAVVAMLGFVFDVQRRNSVYATCAASNAASSRVLEKAGLTLAARWPHRDEVLGLEETHLGYYLNRDSWLRTKPAE